MHWYKFALWLAGPTGIEPATYELRVFEERGSIIDSFGDIERKFRDFLSANHSLESTRDMLLYTRKYHELLAQGDLNVLQGFSPCKRRHVLASLSALSQFLGRYEEFKSQVKAYGVKWESSKPEDLLIRRLSKAEADDDILAWVEKFKSKFHRFAVLADLALVNGMRFVEAVKSYNLIIDLAKEGRLDEYYDSEKQILEHYRFKELFIRHNKKVFVSIVPRNIVERAQNQEKLTAVLIYDVLKRLRIKPRFSDLREYYATRMTKFLSQSEIDFLQGRISGSVFMRNYFNPALIVDLEKRTLKGTEILFGKMDSKKLEAHTDR